jgi:hypothetical protein
MEKSRQEIIEDFKKAITEPKDQVHLIDPELLKQYKDMMDHK